MRFFITLFILCFSFNLKANFQESEEKNMFALHVAYWSGCVRSKVYDLGKSRGKHVLKCKDLAKNKKFGFIDFSEVLLIMEESRHLFYKGCLIGNENASEKEVYEKCHILTKSYFKDMEDILFQEPINLTKDNKK